MAKCGIQTIHGKCYLCTKPGCSEAANNADSELTSVDGIKYVRLSFIGCKLLLLFGIKADPVWRGLRRVYVSSALFLGTSVPRQKYARYKSVTCMLFKILLFVFNAPPALFQI